MPNAPVAFDPPASVAAATPAPASPTVDVQEVGDGLW
jgi:hypothetical protein